MVERRGKACLPGEPLCEVRIGRKIGRHELQSHLSPQVQLLGQVDDAHPTATEFLLDAKAHHLRANRNHREAGLQELLGRRLTEASVGASPAGRQLRSIIALLAAADTGGARHSCVDPSRKHHKI